MGCCNKKLLVKIISIEVNTKTIELDEPETNVISNGKTARYEGVTGSYGMDKNWGGNDSQ